MKELLAKGAYVDPVSVYGTPLHIAALEGKDNTLKILLDHDADVSSTAYHHCLKLSLGLVIVLDFTVRSLNHSPVVIFYVIYCCLYLEF